MIHLGETAKHIREAFGLTQQEAAQRMGVTNIHIHKIETNKSAPSPAMLSKYREAFGVDVYVFAWCRWGDVESLPEPIQKAARALARAWTKRISELVSEAAR